MSYLLLEEMYQRMMRTRKADLAAYVGGDEFIGIHLRITAPRGTVSFLRISLRSFRSLSTSRDMSAQSEQSSE
jgi:hypothetical protein